MDNTVNIVMSSSREYIVHTFITLLSVLENSRNDIVYNVNILHTDIPGDIEDKFLNIINNKSNNFKIQFNNLKSKVDKISFITNNHISKETYYRILSPYLFKGEKKIIYIDSDVIFKTDISTLFYEDLEGKAIGATYDIDFIGQYSIKYSAIRYYSNNILKLNQPYNYFQAGVLIIDTYKFCEKYSCDYLLKYSADKKYKFADQDVFNVLFVNDVHLFSQDWNVVTDCNKIRIKKIIKYAPQDLKREYFEARKSPKVIHFSGEEKPWISKNMDFSQEYAKYVSDKYTHLFEYKKDENKKDNLKKVSLILLPQLSPIRELIKIIYYKLYFGGKIK